MNRPKEVGERGESEAAAFLKKSGLKIVTQNFGTRWGEIDLIAWDNDTLVFVEVKKRELKTQPSAADSISLSKQKKLIKAGLMYMKMKRLEGSAMRFDVVLIEAGAVEWLQDAFQSTVSYTF